MRELRTTRSLALVIAAATIAQIASTQPVLAQSPRMGPGMMDPGTMGQGMMGQGMMGGGMHGGMGQGMMPGMMPGMMMGFGIDGRLDYLKTQIGITEAQQTAWDAYVKAVKGRFEAMHTMHNQMYAAMQKGSPVARLEARISGMEAMLQSLKDQKPAVEALYGSLSDEQKQKADQLLGHGWGMM